MCAKERLIELMHDFVLFEGHGEGAQLKCVDRDLPRSRLAIDDDLRTERPQGCRPVAGRIRMDEAAADGSPIAYRAVGDARGDMLHHPPGHIGQRAIFDIRVGHQRPDEQMVGRSCYHFHGVQGANVDQPIRPR